MLTILMLNLNQQHHWILEHDYSFKREEINRINNNNTTEKITTWEIQKLQCIWNIELVAKLPK